MKLLFTGYKTNKGLFLQYPSGFYNSNSVTYIINNDPTISFKHNHTKGWGLLENVYEITSIKKVTQSREFCGFKIIDSNDAQKLDIPYSFPPSAEEIYEGNIDFELDFKYATLYERVYTTVESDPVNVEFEVNLRCEETIEFPSDPNKTLFKVKTDFSRDRVFQVGGDKMVNVSYDEYIKATIPEPFLHNHPCKFSSQTVYEIVRTYIKDNINPISAKITSDYDFCFTVQHRVKIKPIEYKKEILTNRLKSYRPPRFVTKVQEEKLITIFEMAPKTYNNYPIIQPIYGDNYDDLIKNMENFLEEVITRINTPLVQCPTCTGSGYCYEKHNN